MAGGLALVAAAPANATETPDAPAVTSENFDLSELSQKPTSRTQGGGNGDCGDKPCVPITWCEDKPKGNPPHKGDAPVSVPENAAAAIIGDENGNGEGPKDGDKPLTTPTKPEKPECTQIPTVHIDDEDCCKNPPGGTIYVKMFNPNKYEVPAQITVKAGGKEHTEFGWLKPGKTVVKLKDLKNGHYHVKVHLYDCIFKGGAKFVKIKCDKVIPTPTKTVTATPTATATATPTATPTSNAPTTATPTPSESETDPVPGTGGGSNTGGGELALTGSGSGIWYAGGTLIFAGLMILGLMAFMRRRRVSFAAE